MPQEKLVWTNALLPGYRPSPPAAMGGADGGRFLFTAMVELADAAQGTRYTATVLQRAAQWFGAVRCGSGVYFFGTGTALLAGSAGFL